MVEELGECLLVVLLQLVILIEQFLLLLFVLKLKSSVLENVHDYIFRLLLQENVADA